MFPALGLHSMYWFKHGFKIKLEHVRQAAESVMGRVRSIYIPCCGVETCFKQETITTLAAKL